MVQVIIVDDEPAVLSALTMVVRALGFNCLGFNSARRALESLLEGQQCQAVLTDLRMPEIDGMELLSQLKTTLPELPVVMMSGHADLETRNTALRLGAYSFLQKPFPPDELKDILGSLGIIKIESAA